MEMGTKKVPRIEPSKACDVGLGRPTLIDDCHALPVSWITSYRLVNCEVVRGEMTPDHRGIPPRYPAGGNGAAQKPMCPVGFGNDKEPGSLLIEPVHHPGPLGVALLGQSLSPPEKRIDEGAGPVSRRRVNYHSSRLVDDQHRLVLVNDADRDVLAGDRALLDYGNLDPDDLARLRLVARLLAPSIDENVPLSDKGCRLGAGKLRPLADKEVEADIAVRLDGKLSDIAQG